MFKASASIAIGALGLLSIFASLSNADESPQKRRPSIEYKCEFEGTPSDGKFGKERLQCWAEGTLCGDRMNSPNPPTAANEKSCEHGNDKLRIRCSNGFRLNEVDAAVAIERGSLWINGDSHDDLASIRVGDFLDELKHSHGDFAARADLLVSNENNCAHRLPGRCRFDKKDW